MKRLLPLVLMLSLGGCEGPDQFIVTRCEHVKGAYNGNKACTCFRDGLKKRLPGRTYEALAQSALDHNERWTSHLATLTAAKKSETATTIVTTALTCAVVPWNELAEGLF